MIDTFRTREEALSGPLTKKGEYLTEAHAKTQGSMRTLAKPARDEKNGYKAREMVRQTSPGLSMKIEIRPTATASILERHADKVVAFKYRSSRDFLS